MTGNLAWFTIAADRAPGAGDPVARDGFQSEPLARLGHAIALVGARLDSEDNPGLAAMACVEASNAGAWIRGFADCLRIISESLHPEGNP